MKILVAEDDPAVRTLLRRALGRLGHEIIDAEDGEEAWEVLQKHAAIRVVVSDWVMPQTDGLALCRRIRARRGADYVYFVLLTGRDATEENQAQAADAGVDDFLTKPVKISELWTRLRVAERILRYTTQVRRLEGLLPICSYCKKIRDDKNYWQQIEGYISARTGADFSHCVCPDCYTRVVVPELKQLKTATAKKNPPRARKHPAS